MAVCLHTFDCVCASPALGRHTGHVAHRGGGSREKWGVARRSKSGVWRLTFLFLCTFKFSIVYKQIFKMKIFYAGSLVFFFFWSQWDDVNDIRHFMYIMRL